MAKRVKVNTSKRSRNPQKKVILASLKLALEKNWDKISLGDIAKAANVPISEFHQIFRSKNSILIAFHQQMDTEVFSNVATASSNETVRDQLFELLMLRFDVLTRQKMAITKIIYNTISRNPIASFIGLKNSQASMGMTLESAGVSTKGLLGQLKVNGLLAVYLSTFFTWLKDDTPDLTRTMAELDKGLARAEEVLCSLPFKTFKNHNPKLN